MKNINIALIQQQMQENYASNLEHSLKEIQSAAINGADLVVLCELHTSLYFCQHESAKYFDLAQPIPGPLTESLSQAANNNNVVIVGSVFEEHTEDTYHNTAVVFEKDGSLAGMYRKMHIPNDPNYFEKYYFTPGDLGFTPIETSLGKLGVLVCWDQWFPEAARLMTLAGAEILIYPSAIGWDLNDDETEQQRQLAAWQTIQQSHAIANNLPVVCVNRTGFEEDPSKNTKGINFWGQSFACDAFGKVLSKACNDQTETLHINVDLSETESLRKTWLYLQDRRIDAYQDINKQFIDNKTN